MLIIDDQYYIAQQSIAVQATSTKQYLMGLIQISCFKSVV